MKSHWHEQLTRALADHPALLTGVARGIEKESLRVTADGVLANSAHPAALGSALTHSSITTDYSEALMEFITPVSTSIEGSLTTLENIHSFVYEHLGQERLWSASMPCIVAGDAGVPVARYGDSNSGRMKTVYRYGLGHRYGRVMQAIAGVHYNVSLPEAYWPLAMEGDGFSGSLENYKNTRYLGLIRNFHRWSWLLIYLFGASPAVCASFMRGRGDHHLEPFDNEGNSLHLPYATALRMGDLGYNSSAQKSLRVCYNSLDNYLATLTDAILTPHSGYGQFQGKVDGEYQQLNDSLLQIENEFYSTIRPKRPANSGETALTALHERGIEYVEVRCVDVSPFEPLGISAEQIRFIDAFILHCLIERSPLCTPEQQERQGANLRAVVNEGRRPGLELQSSDGTRTLTAWAEELLDAVGESAALLDQSHGDSAYGDAVEAQRRKVRGEDELPSARVLREMAEQNMPYYRFALNYSNRWAEHFRERPLEGATRTQLLQETQESLAQQKAIEAGDELTFEQYLAAYYDQYQAIRTGD